VRVCATSQSHRGFKSWPTPMRWLRLSVSAVKRLPPERQQPLRSPRLKQRWKETERPGMAVNRGETDRGVGQSGLAL
jgi:hypothetical protein